MSEFNLSNSSETDDIKIENVPFFHAPHIAETSQLGIKASEHQNELNCDRSESLKIQPQIINELNEIKDSPKGYSARFENEKWADSKSETNQNEYQVLIDQLKERTKHLEKNKQNSIIEKKYNQPEGENIKTKGNAFNKSDYISIPRNELTEINYSRLLLEKQVSFLKENLSDKEKEIFALKSLLESDNKGFEQKSIKETNEFRITPLKKLDNNIRISKRNSGKDIEQENKEAPITVKEKNSIQKQLHDSLKINDRLNENIREFKEKLNDKDNEINRLTRKISSSNKKQGKNQHRSSSSFASNNTKYESIDFEAIKSDLEISIKKNNELNKEVLKYELEIQDYKLEINEIETKLRKKEKKITELEENSESIYLQINKLKEENQKLTENLKDYEKNAKNVSISFMSKENEIKLELEKKNSEVGNLKRAFDIIHTEKDELEKKLKDYEEIKSTNSQLSKNYEMSKYSEIHLLEEISSLKSLINKQEQTTNDLQSKLNMIQSAYQSLEFDYHSCSKSLSTKEINCNQLSEKNSKLLAKIDKTKKKLKLFKQEKHSNYNDFKDITRDYLNEKAQVSKLFDQNSELKFHIKSLEETRDKMMEKIENLTTNRNDLLSKSKLLEEQLNNIKNQSEIGIKKYIDEYEKISNEFVGLKQEIKRKNEEIIMNKAETRKIIQEKNEMTVTLKKSQEQEELQQKLLKSSATEIQKISERLNYANRAIDEKEIKISQLNSELLSSKNQISILNADLKQLENTLRVLNIDNYSLQSKIEELDKIRSQNVSENDIKDDYYKLLRAYQHLSDDFKSLSMSINDSKIEKHDISNSFTRKNDDIFFMNEKIEKLEIKIQGITEEKLSVERKLEFTLKEKHELEMIVEKLKEDIKIKEHNNIKSENIMKEVTKYKNEIQRLESDQNLLKKELEQALHKLQHAKNKTHSLEEHLRKRKMNNS